MLVGLFEPVGAPWSLDGVPDDFAFGTLPPDWDRLGPYLDAALARIPSLSEVGVRLFFCGPESFTRTSARCSGPPGTRRLLRGRGHELTRHPHRWRRRHRDGALDRRRRATRRCHRLRRRPRGRPRDLPAVSRRPHRRATRRAVRRRGLAHLEAGLGARRAALGAARPTGGGRRHFNASVGWEFAEWYDTDGEHPATTLDFARQSSFDIVGREHRAVREDVGVLDMSLMAKFLVQGPDAERVLERLSVSVVGREIGRLVYTQWLNTAGGIAADLTVTRLGAEKFLVVTSDLIHRRVEPMIRREARPDEVVVVTEITSGTTLLSVQGPKSRTLLSRLGDADLSNAAFPYLSAKQIHVGYAPVLAVRVTYLGELGWELHIPAEYAAGVFDELTSAGADLGLRPVGTRGDVEPAPGEGLPGHRCGHRQHRQPHRGRPRIHRRVGQTGWFRRPRRSAGVQVQGPPRNRVVNLFVDDPRPTCSAMSPCWSTATGSDTCGRLRTATPSAVRSAWRRCRTRPG